MTDRTDGCWGVGNGVARGSDPVANAWRSHFLGNRLGRYATAEADSRNPRSPGVAELEWRGTKILQAS